MEGGNLGEDATIKIRDFKPRLYQEAIFATAVQKNTLVVLPTGLGKTAIAIMLAAHRLNAFPTSKVVILSPTKPLAEQHLKSFLRFLSINENEAAVFTGMMSPQKRAELWGKLRIISSTPQGLENDIIGGKIHLSEVSLLVIDEAHRAVGNYAYGFIANAYVQKARFPRILALTASPGSTTEGIMEVCRNLFIEAVEIRSEHDPDVKPYIQKMEFEWVSVELPSEFVEVKKLLEECFNSKVEAVNNLGITERIPKTISKKEILMLQGSLHAQIAAGEKSFEAMQAVSLLAEAMKVQHALELLETQGIRQLNEYFEKLEEESVSTRVRAVKNLVADPNFKKAVIKAREIVERGLEHPKLAKLSEIVAEEIRKKSSVKMIIFTQYRDSASRIIEEISKIQGAFPKIFVGQAKKKDTGMSQKEQKALLESFSRGDFNILVATSIGEEGLDIPQVDIVIFYEPIPSAIRTIQRRGRTGRHESGRVIMLITKNTRDEMYRWSAFYKERKMRNTLQELKKGLTLNGYVSKQESVSKELKLSDFNPEGIRIRVKADSREKGSMLLRELSNAGVEISLESLEVADYVLSDRVAVEIKRIPDFVDSIIDGRLLSQLKNLANSYERPILILEGTEDIYSIRNIHPNAIRGMLATIVVSYGVPVVQTKNFRETAALLMVIARREQLNEGSDFNMHAEKKLQTEREQQEYIVSSLPGVGADISRELLHHFGSVRNVFNASEEELKEVALIGEKKARAIRRIIDSEYAGSSKKNLLQ
ncbi:MAG: DEAD/DEAH box helicase [Candidatus Woesearchaeota archaeon]